MTRVGAAKVVASTPCNQQEFWLPISELGDKRGKVDELVQDLVTISHLLQGLRSVKRRRIKMTQVG
jgi:hypothetical protein